MPQPSRELLDELFARYILNVPTGELDSTERMMFVIEEAHWFYEDHYREDDPTLKQFTLKEFTKLVFEQCPGMESYRHLTDEIYKSFQAFKATVPCMGGILLDPTMNYVLLAKGYKSNAAWGFPRGKISKDETDSACAIRELIEETGFDISDKLVEDDYIETFMRGQRLKLYIITDVSTDTPFAPVCKGEISAYAWHEIKDLPTTKDEFTAGSLVTEDGSRHRFFMVWPFIKKLRTFIKQRRKAKRQQQQQPQQQQGTPVMLTEFEAAQLAAERALSGTVQQQQQQQQAVPSMLSEFQAAQQAAEKALGHSNEDTAGSSTSKKKRRNKRRSEPGKSGTEQEVMSSAPSALPLPIQEAHAAPIATATTPSAAAVASPWRHFSLDTHAVMSALALGMAGQA